MHLRTNLIAMIWFTSMRRNACDRMLYRSWPMSFSIILERKALHAEFAGFPLPLSPQCDEGCSSPCCSKASKFGKITIASVARRLGALTAANAVGNVILLSFSYIFRRQQRIALEFRQEQDIPQSFKQADITDHPRWDRKSLKYIEIHNYTSDNK